MSARRRHHFTDGPLPGQHGACRYCGMTVAQTLLDSNTLTHCPSVKEPEPEATVMPKFDEHGRFCSFNTLCGRGCTPKERDSCYYWLHAKDE